MLLHLIQNIKPSDIYLNYAEAFIQNNKQIINPIIKLRTSILSKQNYYIILDYIINQTFGVSSEFLKSLKTSFMLAKAYFIFKKCSKNSIIVKYYCKLK